jgi:uncharacterized protein (TIGR03437 family)
VNLASGRAGDLAPNTLAAIYGRELSAGTRARAEADLQAGLLPYVLPGTGVTVKVNGLLAGVEYASPEVVVFVVPAELLPGPAQVILARNALSGPVVRVELLAAAPALMIYEGGWVLARHAGDLSWVTSEAPTRPGEEVVLYATGLGPTVPPQMNRRVVSERSEIEGLSGLRVVVGEEVLDPSQVVYAGVTPGMAGLYEIRLVLPRSTGEDPGIGIQLGDRKGQQRLRIYTRVQPEAAPVRSID